jgi:hypothetical protein
MATLNLHLAVGDSNMRCDVTFDRILFLIRHPSDTHRLDDRFTTEQFAQCLQQCGLIQSLHPSRVPVINPFDIPEMQSLGLFLC